MKILLIFEGSTDLLFFLHTLKKFEFEELSKGRPEYNEHKIQVLRVFGGIVEVPFIRIVYKKEKYIILVPLGGNKNIEKIVTDKLFKIIKEKFKKVVVIVDSDTGKVMKNIPLENKVIYRGILEDIIFEILKSDEKNKLEELFASIKNILKFKDDDKLIKKAKIKLLNAIYNPESFEPFVRDILKDKNKDELSKIYEIKELLKRIDEI